MILSRTNVAIPDNRLPITNKVTGSILRDSLAAARVALRPTALHGDSPMAVFAASLSATAWPARSALVAGLIVGASSVGPDGWGDAGLLPTPNTIKSARAVIDNRVSLAPINFARAFLTAGLIHSMLMQPADYPGPAPKPPGPALLLEP